MKIGLYSITGCNGCLLSIVFDSNFLKILNLVEIVNFPFIQEINKEVKLDYCFIEGSVSKKEEIEFIKKLRNRSKNIVAIGACAISGNVQALKHFMDKKKVEKAAYSNIKHLNAIDSVPIEDYIKVDYNLRGCPIQGEEVYEFIKKIKLGIIPKETDEPICHNCKMQENLCIFKTGRPCLGPVTYGNCKIMCPHNNLGCTGCRGPSLDPNFESIKEKLLEIGIDEKEVINRINKYAGLKIK